MNKTILITGASRGIGYDLSKCFFEQGHKIIGTSTSGTLANKDFIAQKLELPNAEDINDLVSFLNRENITVDIFINNAGIGPDLGTMKPDLNSYQQTIDVNLTGPTFLTESLIPFINEGGKIINISSKMGSINQCESEDSVAYRISKAGLNMYSKILTNRYEGKLKIAVIHPGWVRTNISENSALHGRLSPEDSGKRIFDFINSDFKSGIFWDVETHSELEW